MSGVALIHHTFGPYHLARVRALQPALSEPLHLVELASSEQLRAWRVEREEPIHSAAKGVLEQLPASTVKAGVRRILDALSPDVLVVAGYAEAGMREASTWARRNGRPAILLSDSQAGDKRRVGPKELMKQLWIRANFAAAFTSGAEGAQYLRSLGVEPQRIWRGYDAVDNTAFAHAAGLARAAAATTRHRLQLPERYFLYVGRFAPEKNLFVLLEAFAKYRAGRRHKAASLVLAGSGPLEQALRARITSLGLDAHVRLPGFLQEAELGAVYGLATALVLPSLAEPWGLVVNEAMAASLPVALSTKCGCATDLVFPGVNGFHFDPLDDRAIAAAMQRLDSDDALTARMGEQSAKIIAPWSLERWAWALADCVRSVRVPA